MLIIKVNVTVPEIVSSANEIDFGDVIVGQRKTVTIRYSNNKEVDCKWHVAAKEELVEQRNKNEKAAEGRFIMLPKEGLMPKYT